ncbi:retrovirus-related pol polyprotein from transposon TNT 1-94 [Tanacetum coccineum]
MLFTMPSWKQNLPYKFKWTEKTVSVAEGSLETTTEGYMENYKNVSQDIRDQLNAEAEAVQIILTGIDNDIYSIVDVCPNACEMWKAIERLKQGESINVQDLETNLYWEFRKFTSRDGESFESYYSRFYKMMNELVKNQYDITNHQVNVQFLLQLQPEWQRFVTLVKQSQELKTVSYHKLYDILKQHQNEVNKIRAKRLARTANPLALVAQQQPVYHPQNHPNHNTQYSSTRSQQPTRNRGKSIFYSYAPIYDQEPATVTEDDEMSKEKEIDKLMALISLSVVNIVGARENIGTQVVQKFGIQCYNYKEYGHVSRECQKPKRVKDAAYHKEKMLLCKQKEAGVQLNAEQADWKDDTDDESDDQELEAHYMYMAEIQEVTPDAVDNSGPIFDAEPLHKVQNYDDNYNVFAIENEHPEQPESVNDIYLEEQGDTNITIDSLDICYDREQDDQDDTDELDQERDLLASLIEKLKCEIDDSKNRNKFLETSNKALVDKLKGDIEDFKTKNKSLESSNNHFKEANNELSKTNQLMFKDLKKFQAELDKYHDVNYASKVAIDCAKAKGDLIKNSNKLLESSNKILVDKLTSQIEDFKNTNKSIESSNTRFKEANNELSKTNQLMFKDLKKFQDELEKRHDVNYMSTVELDISDMKKELVAHQETISIMSQQKEDQKKFYKTREEKELEKVIALENKIKVLDDVYKTGQSIQTMNMLNHNCKTSFVKPKFLKKSQRANPRLYDIEIIHNKTWHGYIDPVISSTIETNFDPLIHKLMTNTERFFQSLKEKIVVHLKYFNSLENEIEYLQSQLVTQRTQFLNEIDRLFREYYYADYINAILGVYTTLNEFTDLQCDYVDQVVKCERLEKELSKRNTTSKSFEALRQHAIDLELALQQYLKAQLQDKNIALCELKKLYEKLKGKSMETKFEKPPVIHQPNAYKDQRSSVLGVIPTTSVSRQQLKTIDWKIDLNAKTSNVNFVCVTCGKCVLSDNHDMCVLYYINGVNSRTKQLIDVPIILFIADSRCSKHMTGNLKLLSNFMEKILGTVKFKNDQIAPILGYRDLVQGNVTIKRVYYVEWLNHNLFSVGQFCSRGTDVYSITLQDTSTPNPICLMAKATSLQACLWHHRLSHLNFNTINLLSKYDIVTGLPKLKFVKDHLRSSCELGKEKRKSFKTKTTQAQRDGYKFYTWTYVFP